MKQQSNDDVTNRIEKIADAGKPYLEALKSLPPDYRIYAFTPLPLLGVLIYIILVTPEVRPAALLGIFAVVVLCVVFPFILARGIHFGTQHKLSEFKEHNVVIPTPSRGNVDGVPVRYKYDVYVAAPMASQNDSDRKELNEKFVEIVRKIQEVCEYTAFYAGFKFDSSKKDDDPEFALRSNAMRMRASKLFVLIYPKYEPTSTLVETGMALALNKPSVWFIKRGIKLPYIMNGPQAGGKDGLPYIKLIEFDTLEEICGKIERFKHQLFHEPIEPLEN